MSTTQTTVYLIDDEPELVSLLSEVVTQLGLSVRGFTRAGQFFKEVRQFTNDAILILDLHIPEMDGIEVMRRLVQMDNPPALVLISGRDIGVLHAAEKLGRAHNLDILASLTKPVSLQRLRQLLEIHMAGSPKVESNPRDRLKYVPSPEELQQALRQDQLVLHYQPQVDIPSGVCTSVEALVRWHHPEHGLLLPKGFIPMAEQYDLITLLTHWVVEHVVEQSQQWQRQGISLEVSVNISARDIIGSTLPKQLYGLLESKQLDPTCLTLEVTESALMGELAGSLDILTQLRTKGIALSVDDFGTGYSSLSQLLKAPFSELKIDRSFVSRLTTEAEAQAIVKTCILLSHELNMRVVAEGVETKEQYQQLRELGCDMAQGYLISKPVPAEEIKPNMVFRP
ncbi:MAG: EAL domain-containing response regulator [Chromatiales bacterium]|nr:EAL domain-containing response regulator [Chromatiales bacterium]